MRHSDREKTQKKGLHIFPEKERDAQGERLDSCACVDVSDVSVAEQIAAKGETNGNAKEQSGIDTVERKEQGKPLSFYLSPEITLAAPTTVTHRPSFSLSLSPTLSWLHRDKANVSSSSAPIFNGKDSPHFFFLLSFGEEHRRILSAVLFAAFLYLFIFIYLAFGAFGFPIAWSTIHRRNRVRSNLISFFSSLLLSFRCKLGVLCAVGGCLSFPCFLLFLKRDVDSILSTFYFLLIFCFFFRLLPRLDDDHQLLWRQSNQTWSISRGELDSKLDSAQSKSNAPLHPFRTLSYFSSSYNSRRPANCIDIDSLIAGTRGSLLSLLLLYRLLFISCYSSTYF